MDFNLAISLEGAMESNALLKSKDNNRVTNLLCIPDLMSSVSFNKAVSVLLYCLNPV